MDRLGDKQALELYRSASLHELGRAADDACRAKHPEPWRTFVVDRNVNYTNVCAVRCRFCAFSVDASDPRAGVLGREELLAKVAELVAIGGTQVLLQGGMHPGLPLEFHLQMLRDIRRGFPSVQIHAFSPPEIWFFHDLYALGVQEVIARLVDAGLDSIPGGGAEILVDSVRAQVSPRKCTASQWLAVMETAHAMGLFTTATMMLGHLERDEDRVEHLHVLRELQDRSLDRGKGRFTAFICWTFQPHNTPLEAQGQALAPSGAQEYLRTLALARLYLDNFDNLQASWVTQGPKVGQLSLFYGANDMGGLMMEENVVSAAGTSFHMDRAGMCRLISDAGFAPRQRSGLYQLLD